MSLIVGIDIGGTFTDIVMINATDGQRHYLKVPSTRENPSKAALTGLNELFSSLNIKTEDLAGVSHGTTVGTNAILEGKQATTAMVTTEGFRDVIELARQRRPDLWHLDIPKPNPIASRDLRFEVEERIDHTGEVLTPPSEEVIRTLLDKLGQSEAAAVAVCFLHAYANRDHEEQVAQAIREAHPQLFVSTSNDVVNEFREYERFSSTVLNAALMPVMDRYLSDFEEGVRSFNPDVPLRVMQSNGGIMSSGMARRKPINTFLSGPAAGVVGAIDAAVRTGNPDFITFDMGGTSTDVALVEAGQATLRLEQVVAGLPVKTPTIDVNTVGAGGGSIAWLDAMGLLKVGPRSAGAYPGPACYGRGGTEPTVSDANMFLGRLNPVYLLGGRMKVDHPAAITALDKVAKPLELSTEAAAAGILRIVTANMVQAIRVISVERGMDPRNYALVAYGGAGPLHAAEVAMELGMRRVLVPANPGLLCALGLLHSRLRIDFSQTRLIQMQAGAELELNALIDGLHHDLLRWRKEENLETAALDVSLRGDFRYQGQDFELSVPVPDRDLGAADIPALLEAFHNMHLDQYGYDSRGQEVQLVALRLAAIGKAPELPALISTGDGQLPAPLMMRKMWFESTGWSEAPVYDRASLQAGNSFSGPAGVEQMDSITIVPPEMVLTVAPTGDLLLEMKA